MTQKLIDELQTRRNKLVDMAKKQKALSDTTYYSLIDKASELNAAIILIQSKLPDFEDAIKKAYEDGYYDGLPNAIKKDNGLDGDAQDYYNQNYKNE